MELSQRAQSIKPSPTLSVSAHAAALHAAGKDIISLAAGEPDFDTPDPIKEAAIEAIKKGITKYTPVAGMVSLKQSIVDKFERENGLRYDLGQILVSVGAKHSFYNLAQSLLNTGDQVIIPAPYWVSYPDMTVLAGAKPVVIETTGEQKLKINAEQLKKAITPKTRLLVLNSPSNPTGASYSLAELKELGSVLEEHPDIIIASDDIYEHIYWEQQPFANIVNACPTLATRTVVINGVSKAYSMTGWRIGYAAGPAKLINAMADLQSQSTSNPTSIAQVASQAALDGDQSIVKERCQIFKQRHDFLHDKLNQIPGVRCLPSQGTFYAFPDMNGVIAELQGIDNDIELAEYFIDKAGVALVPGSAFGAPGYMRLSFATSMEMLESAVERLEKAIAG